MSSLRLALFDMDRTLLSVDSATLYARWRREHGRSGWLETAKVAGWMLKYTFGVLDAPRVAAKIMGGFRGDSESEMAADCELWFQRDVLPRIAERGRRRVEAYRSAGVPMALITSATRYVAQPLARELGLDEVLCTELAVDQGGRFTGELVLPICFGPGKVSRAEALANRHGCSLADAVFYTDSITDLPLLSRVGTPIAVNPDLRLRREVRRRGWLSERW